MTARAGYTCGAVSLCVGIQYVKMLIGVGILFENGAYRADKNPESICFYRKLPDSIFK
jgi:hypothetical protein